MTIEVPIWLVWMFAGTLWLLVVLDLIRAYLNWRIFQLRKGGKSYEERIAAIIAHDFMERARKGSTGDGEHRTREQSEGLQEGEE